MSSKKKVLIVSDYISGTLGGIETYIHNLKKVLNPEFFEIKYFGGENINRLKKYLFLLLSNNNFLYAKNFEKVLKEYKPDIIRFHSVSRLLGPKIIEKANKSNAVKIMTYHDFGYFSLFAKNIYDEKDIPEKFNLKEFLKKSGSKGILLLPYSILKFSKLKKLRKVLSENIDIHTIPSKFMKKYVRNLGYSDTIEVLPNFILKDQIGERSNKYQDKINFIFFGRLEKEKGIGLLINFLGELWEMKYKDRKKYLDITSKIRIFIFGDGKEKKQLLESFIGEDLNSKDISILENVENRDNVEEVIDSDEKKFIYFFGRRDYETIKSFLGFSHYHIGTSLFLETFGLSALQACANGVVNITTNKENIKNFALADFIIDNNNIKKDFNEKLFNIIEKHKPETWEKYSLENKKLSEKFII